MKTQPMIFLWNSDQQAAQRGGGDGHTEAVIKKRWNLIYSNLEANLGSTFSVPSFTPIDVHSSIEHCVSLFSRATHSGNLP